MYEHHEFPKRPRRAKSEQERIARLKAEAKQAKDAAKQRTDVGQKSAKKGSSGFGLFGFSRDLSIFRYDLSFFNRLAVNISNSVLGGRSKLDARSTSCAVACPDAIVRDAMGGIIIISPSQNLRALSAWSEYLSTLARFQYDLPMFQYPLAFLELGICAAE